MYWGIGHLEALSEEANMHGTRNEVSINRSQEAPTNFLIQTMLSP